MNVSKAPDDKPVVEYKVSSPYTPDKDNWMKEYAQEHRTSNNEELHLFTFSNGKQYEYNLLSAKATSNEKGFLFSGNWTEEPNETLKPTKISEQQFEQNMNSILSKWSDARYEWKPSDQYGEALNVYINEKMAVTGYDVIASIMKNYIDLKPDRTSYAVMIVTPSATGDSMVHSLIFEPDKHLLVALELSSPNSTPTLTVWSDGTYTSIVNSIETNDFTNNPGKVGNPEYPQ